MVVIRGRRLLRLALSPPGSGGYLSPSHLLDAVEELLDATGTRESEPEERLVVAPDIAARIAPAAPFLAADRAHGRGIRPSSLPALRRVRREPFRIQGCVTPAKITRSANVKSPGVVDGRVGVNPETWRYDPASRFSMRANVSATIRPPTGPS